MKLLSIIIPVYNIPTPTLKRCLNSVISLPHDIIEVIVVNDASPNKENLQTILDLQSKYPKIFHVIDFRENKGVSHARNAGLDICKGEYVAFVDADDIIIPKLYETMLSKARERNFDIVRCGSSTELDARGDKVIEGPGMYFSMLNYAAEDITKVTWWVMWTVCSRLYRRNFIGTIRFSENVRFFEDSSFAWKLIQHYPKFLSIEGVAYKVCYRQNSASRQPLTKHKYVDMLNSALIIFDEISDFAEKHPVLAKYMYTLILSETLASRTMIRVLEKNDVTCIEPTLTLYSKYMTLDSRYMSHIQKVLLYLRKSWIKFNPSSYPLPLYYISRFFIRNTLNRFTRDASILQ